MPGRSGSSTVVGCDDVAEALPRMVDEVRRCDRRLASHAATCLRCQAELAQYRRMLRMLHQLRLVPPPMPPGADTALVAELRRQVTAGAVGASRINRRQVAAGVAAAGAVVVLGATVAVATVRGRIPKGSAIGCRAAALRSAAALLT